MDAAQVPPPPAAVAPAPAQPGVWQRGAALGALLDAASKRSVAEGRPPSTALSPISSMHTPPAQASAIETAKSAFGPDSALARSTFEQLDRYTRFERLPDGRVIFRDTINGQPVLPPGMTPEEASRYLSHDWAAARRKTAKTFIFISLGMPEPVLRHIFNEVARSSELREDAVFMVRGWPDEPDGLPRMVGRLYALQPKGVDPLPVLVDPTWFQANRITRVPAVLRRLPGGRELNWGILAGDGLGIAEAIKRLDGGRDLSAVIGNTWAITEPDALEQIKARVAKYDFNAERTRVLASGWKEYAAKSARLPQSERGIDMLVDPAVIATEDVKLPDGRVVVSRGQRINPLASPMPWQTLRYIAINASSNWEIEQARKWLASYPSAKVLVTSPPDSADGFAALQDRLGARAFILQSQVAERLGIPATPALVWPHGLMLAVHVEPKPSAREMTK